MFYRNIGPRCCLYRTRIRREGRPDCGTCPVAAAINDLLPDNLEAFGLFDTYLGGALLNLAPFAEQPVFLLDPQWVRLCLDAEQIPAGERPEMIQKFMVLHQAREAVRR